MNDPPDSASQRPSYAELYLTVTEILAANPDLEQAVPEVVAVVGEAMGWDLGVVWLRNEQQRLVRESVWSTDQEAASRFAEASAGVTLGRGEALAGRAWEVSEPLWFDDLMVAGEYPHIGAAAAAGMRSAVCIPLRAGDAPTGVLVYFARRPGRAEPDPARLLRAVGSQLGHFIERKRAEAATELYFTVTEILAANPDLDKAVPQIVTVVGEAMGWDLGVVWLRNDKDRLSRVAVWSSDEEAATRFGQASEGVTLARGESLAGRAWASSEPAWFEDVLAESDYSQVDAAASAGMRAAVCIPLRAGEDATGVLEYFAGRLAPSNGEMIRMLSALGSQLGQFIERKRAEAATRRALAELRRSNEDLEQFAYTASHDLSEPLRVIRGFAELLDDRYSQALDERGREMLDHVARAAAGGEQLIDDLLAFARVGSAELEVERLPLGEIVADAEGKLAAAIADRHARIEYDPAALPRVEGDRIQLIQLLQNLIANGIKFNERDEPRVRITAGPQDGNTLVAVQDDGIGIPPIDVARIFEAFARGQAGGGYPGTGVGLATCQRIVARHGGRLWVENPPIGGSVFCFTVPGARE